MSPIKLLKGLLLLMISILKKTFLLFFLLFLIIILSIICYRFDNYMIYAWEAQIRWGHSSFDSKKFREISTNEKAKMIADLLRKKHFIGETPEKIKENLGDRTGGYYNSEVHLTYEVFKSKRTSWDVVFILDYKTQKIGQIMVYRQGIGITRTVLYFFMELIEGVFDE